MLSESCDRALAWSDRGVADSQRPKYGVMNVMNDACGVVRARQRPEGRLGARGADEPACRRGERGKGGANLTG